MIIVGLGNPGVKYSQTRHNIGFMFLDAVTKANNISFKLIKEFNAMVAEYYYKGEKHYFVKPITFMNNSGMAVFKIKEYYKVSLDEIVIIYDDLDLPTAQLRIRKNGSSGGHNGMKSIISYLQSEDFCRIRIGIDRSEEVIDYVLTTFKPAEWQKIKEVLEKAPNIIDDLLNNGIEYIMNNYNG